MNWRSFIVTLGSCSLLLLTSCSDVPVFDYREIVYKVGDDLQWAQKEYDDGDWKKYLKQVPDGNLYWSRAEIDVLVSDDPPQDFGVELEVYGEYEVFWDGIIIGKNGVPGQEDFDAPRGDLWKTYRIPAELAERGLHLLAIRTSSLHHPDHTHIHDLNIDRYDKLIIDNLLKTSYMHLFAGAFLIVSIYFLFLFLTSNREYQMLIFSVCCFFIFALVITAFSKTYIPMHYGLHVERLRIISTFFIGISFLIPLYFSIQFPFPRKKTLLSVYAGILIIIFFVKEHAYDFKAVSMVYSMWIFSFGIASYGAYQSIRGANLVLVTLVLSFAMKFATNFSVSLYMGLGLILLGMLYLLSLNVKEQRLAYENSLLQSTRLRLELLKKNIQPHFLMNTLTSLIDWVEEAPKKGVQFIEALAKEFDLFNQIENQTLIPISQEIDLCRSHLEIMKYRKEINYIWEEEDIDQEQKVPPAIIHTLLENGITHSLPKEDNSIRFKLTYQSETQGHSYSFITYAEGIRTPSNERAEGTGIKYIKARLTESYGDNWEFVSEPTDHGWRSVIRIFTK